MKRTSLRRRTGLRSITPLKRRTRLRPISPKRRRLVELRRALVSELLAAYPICQVCGGEPSVHVHEIKTRARGGSILDSSNCLAVGFDCHRKIHDEPSWATDRGLLKSAWGT